MFAQNGANFRAERTQQIHIRFIERGTNWMQPIKNERVSTNEEFFHKKSHT
jgi:hypothetical protein